MKKRILSILLIVALLLTSVVVPAQAESGGQAGGQMCEHNAPEAEWSVWDCVGGNPAEGHFYLAENFTAQTQTVTIPYGRDVCIDLRGHTWSTEGIRTLVVSGNLTIMDSVGGGQILTTGAHQTGGAFAVVEANGMLSVYGGTIQRVVRGDVDVYAGGLVYVNGTLNVKGGTLSGGTVRSTDSRAAQGGNIYVTGGGAVNISGGAVTGGMVRKAGSQVAQGGNIYALNGATVNISGGAVTGGYTDNSGGNIFIGGATLNLTGGAITDGHALVSGGNICQSSANANAVNISGGTVTGGVAGGTPLFDASATSKKGSGGGGNYYGNSAKGVLTVSGGTVTGDMKLDAMSTVTLSGIPKIGLGKSNGLHINSTAIKADVSGLTDGAEIFVNAGGVFTQNLADAATAERIIGYFKEAVRMTLSVDGTAIKGSNSASVLTGYCPHCYAPENPQKVTWLRDWASIASGMEDSHVFMRYYSASAKTIPANVVLDLCGITIRRTDRMMVTIAAGKSLTVLDSYGGGTIQGSGSVTESSPSWGGVVYVGKGSTLSLYSGILDMENPNGSYVYAGGVISAPTDGAKVNIYGGIVRDGVVSSNYSSYGFLPGGNIALTYSNSVLNITGGVIIGGSAPELTVSETTYPGSGGNIYTAGTVNISGGFVLDGTASQKGGNLRTTKAAYISGGTIANGNANLGGNLYLKTTAAETTILSGGTVLGGTAEQGGNLYIEANDTGRSITGGTLVGGTAELGGNIYQGGDSSKNDGSLTVSGGAILSGKATSGGNIYFTYSKLNIKGDGLVADGRTDSMGGNIYAGTAATANISGGRVLTGYSVNKGGSIYSAATNNHINVTGGKISDGRADGMGGNIFISNGFLDVTGGVIAGGSAQDGGNIMLYMGYGTDPKYCGTATFRDDGDSTTALAQIIGGKAENLGGNIYYAAFGNASGTGTNTMVLGNCVITDGQAGTAGDDLYVNTKAYLKVLPEFAQRVLVYVHQELLQEGALDSKYLSCEGVYTGQLILENDERLPLIYTDESDNSLKIAVTVLMMKDGTSRGYGDNASAVAVYDENTAYIRPTSGTLELTGGDYTVDVAGQTLAITGTGTVTCFDSGNDAFALCGSVTVSGPTLKNTTQYAHDGKTYITLEENGAYSFHYLQMRISSVALRPGTAGMYYKCIWNCDDALMAQMQSAGVAMSTAHTPDGNFRTDEESLYTATDAATLVRGESRTSAIIENIFSLDAENNSARGKQAIHAVPYVTLKSGTCVVGGNVAYSLYDVLKLMDVLPFYYDNKVAIEGFCSNWEEAMADWDFDNIGVKPSDDSTLRILMVGNSFCYYYVEELYALLMENPPEGIDAVEVYNLYYSGCTLNQHLSWWQAGTAKYDLFVVENGVRKQLGEKQGWTLEAALAQGNWDYISLQSSTTDYHTGDVEAFCQDAIAKAGPILNRFHDQFPDAQLLWQRTWSYEIGRVYGSTVYTEELLEQHNRNVQYVGEKLCEAFAELGIEMVNSGTAWINARALDAAREESLLPYGGLCARLGYNKYGDLRAHSGDGYHDGDIGGGQLLNAYVWYMTITGDRDLSDSTYAPVYKYSGIEYPLSSEFIALLKEAAQQIWQ